MDQQRYTLEEAEKILKRRACNTYGHKYDVIFKRLENKPVRVVCVRCDEQWFIASLADAPTQFIPKVDDSTRVLPKAHQ